MRTQTIEQQKSRAAIARLSVGIWDSGGNRLYRIARLPFS
jgi:hypothetical protein